LRQLPINVLALSNLIAVRFALAQTTTVEVMDDPIMQALLIRRDLSLPATDHLLLQAMVKDTKAAKTLEVVVKDSRPVVDVEAAVDVTAQRAPLVHTMLKMKPLLNQTTKRPTLPISIPTPRNTMLSNAMIPSMMESTSTMLLQVTMKPTTMTLTKAHTLGITTRIMENTEFMRLTPSDLSQTLCLEIRLNYIMMHIQFQMILLLPLILL